MRRLQGIGLLAGLVSVGFVGGVAAAQNAPPNVTSANGTRVEAPARDLTRTAALLGRLQRAAEREAQLGDLAEAGASRPETRVYGAELTEQFRSFDDRVVAFAATNGITAAELDRAAPGENVVAMRRHADDLARLANTRGEAFDRGFWVAVANEQAATSDMLAATLEQDPALDGLVAEFSALLDRSSRRAAVAAEASSLPSTPAVPGAPEQAPADTGGR